ncbi:MAG TPA: hypothetical protein VL306_02585 [Methylomirabilota bacterium]|jgi:hypothetical protein|nr:hypothetical protein [Methylomirabilota bacterium]
MDIETNRMSGAGQFTVQKTRHKKWFKWVLLLLILIVLGVAYFGPQIWLKLKVKGYQAVFLTNGQVYFGKLSASGNWLLLTDIFYLQASSTLQQGSSVTDQTADQSANLQLVKLGGELHGPLDYMYLEKDKVMFWENLKDDSKVVDAIKNYSSKK